MSLYQSFAYRLVARAKRLHADFHGCPEPICPEPHWMYRAALEEAYHNTFFYLQMIHDKAKYTMLG